MKSIPRDWINGTDRLLFLLRSSSLHPPLLGSLAAHKILGRVAETPHVPQVSTEGFLLVREDSLQIKYDEPSRPHWARNVFRFNLSKQNKHRRRWCSLFKAGWTWRWAQGPAPHSVPLANSLTSFPATWPHPYPETTKSPSDWLQFCKRESNETWHVSLQVTTR